MEQSKTDKGEKRKMRKKWLSVMAGVCACSLILSAAPAYTVPVQASVVQSRQQAAVKAIENPVEDGEYTLTFTAKKENSDEESMLGGYFDPKMKLTVKDGKMQLTVLNTALADFLLDFTVGDGSSYADTERTGYGEPTSSGTYNMYEYTMTITDPDQIVSAAALVTAMGGQVSDKGNYDVYIKADFTFTSIEKGWTGYDTKTEEEPVDGKKALNDALIDYGLDKDNDGTVTKEEVAQYGGSKLDLSNCNLSDIDLLRYLPDSVTEINLCDNKITTLPDHLLDNLTNLENFYIENNQVVDIPKGFFENNAKLDWVTFAGNNLTSLEEGDFAGLDNLTILDLERNSITKVDEKALEGMPKIQQLSFASNNLSELPDGCLKPVGGSLAYLFLYENNFRSLPKAVSDCTAVAEISASDNGMTDISAVDFSKLTNLQELNLMNNFIREIPDKAFANNTKLAGVDLYNNQLTSMSLDTLPAGVTLRKLDIRLNNINVVDKKLIAKTQSFNRFYPQKSALGLRVSDGGEKGIAWNQQLSMLDLMFWYEETNDAKVQEIESVDEYQEFLKENEWQDRDIVDVLNEFRYDWDIVVKVQKKQEDGQFVTVHEETISDKADVLQSEYQTQENGVYRVVKEMYSTTSGLKTYRFTVISNECEKQEEVTAPSQTPATTPPPVPSQTPQTTVPPAQTPGNADQVSQGSTADKVKVARVTKVKVTVRKQKVRLSWKKQKQADGYEIYVSKQKKSAYKAAKTTVKNRAVFGKWKVGKNYYIKVRGYRMVQGKKVYGAFSKVKAVTIKKK